MDVDGQEDKEHYHEDAHPDLNEEVKEPQMGIQSSPRSFAN